MALVSSEELGGPVCLMLALRGTLCGFFFSIEGVGEGVSGS